jgi:hypothetical protein
VKNTTFRLLPGGVQAHVEFEEYSQAAEARMNLNGIALEQLVMHAKLDSTGLVSGNIYEPPAIRRQTKLVWDAPSVSGWAFYPTVGMAKAESERLNGIMYGDRKITAEYVKPTQTHSIPVRLQGLPLDVKREELLSFCISSSSVSLNSPNYRQSQNDSIRSYLAGFGPVNSFDVLPTDPSHLEITGFVEFETNVAAATAVKALKETRHDFLGKGRILAHTIFHSKYDCSHCPFAVIRDDLDRLRSSSADSGCTIECSNQPPMVHIYSRQAKALAVVKKSVQDLLFGFELECWDPYFDTSSSAEALKRINDDTSFHVRSDRRRRGLRIWGNRDKAEKQITRLLKHVQAKRHGLRFEEGVIPALINGGLQSLHDTFGASKILLDVRSRTITVLGDIRSEVENHLKTLGSVCSRGMGNCCLCYSDAVDPVELACSHIYCSECLKILLQPVPGLDSSTPTCIADQEGPCLEPIPISVISSHLSDTDRTQLFQSSLLSFVRSNREFRFCPSGCFVIYRLGIAGTVFTCPDCRLDLCAFDAVPVHTGLTCAEYETLRESGFEAQEV